MRRARREVTVAGARVLTYPPRRFKEILDECNDRVNSKNNTSETCHQEMVDYVNALDHCVRLTWWGK